VRRGDTLSEIAERQRVRTRTLASWNGLEPPYTIYSGGLLRVKPPGGGAPARSRGARTVASNGESSAARSPAKPIKTSARKPSAGADAGSSGIEWQWPLSGPVKQGFRAGDRTHSGIRIGSALGASVGSAADGTVVYSGSGLKGYGNLIIVRHNDKYLSAYGFNRRLLAGEGNSIERGQTVGECGQGPGGTHLLHFEVRRHGAAVNPILYLPPR
jgi:lipoprotein NlpD